MNKTRTFATPPSLHRGRVHELSGEAALLYALLSLGAQRALLCGPPRILGALNPDGISRFVDPQQLTLALCPLAQDACWAMETALRDSSLPVCLLLTYRTPDLTAFRRLQLAAREGGTLGLVITTEPAPNSAGETRWHCSFPPAKDANRSANSLFQSSTVNVSLYKNKKGTTGQWRVQIDCTANPLSVDATFAGEPVCPQRCAG
ncbi:MAG: ImuA family protein [Parvularcula sp.]